jgi:hypothetical protein
LKGLRRKAAEYVAEKIFQFWWQVFDAPLELFRVVICLKAFYQRAACKHDP